MNDSPCNAADWQPSPAFHSSTPILGVQEPQQIPLALDYAPPQVRKHGLRDAHWTPLAGWYRGGPSFRTTAQLAWRFPLLELDRTANSYAAIGLDVDGRENVISFMDAVLNRRFPEPNFVVERHVSGNIQAHFCLATPIHRGPLATDGPCRTIWGRREPDALAELTRIVPLGWKRPTVAVSVIGRNETLFRNLMRETGKPSNWTVRARGTVYCHKVAVAQRQRKIVAT